MYTYRNAEAGPRTKPVSRWFSIGAILSLSFVLLGGVAALEAKKPVKPPPEPEPPPITESGLLYLRDFYGYSIRVIDMTSTDWAPIDLFPLPDNSLGTEYHLEGDLVPSVLDHSGRWFAAVQSPVIVANTRSGPTSYSLYEIQAGSSPVSPFLVAIDETGAAVRLNTEEDLYQLNLWSQPYWYAGDTRILFLARKVTVTSTVTATTEESKWNPEPEEYTKAYLEPVAGSEGFYVAKISWIDGIPVPDGPFEILEWSRGLWPDDEYYYIESFAVTQDGSTLYLNRPREDQGSWLTALSRVDLQTGEHEELLATGLTDVALNTGETRIYGNGPDPDYPLDVIRYVDLHSPGPLQTIPPPSEDVKCWDPVIAPSDQALAFGQATQTGKSLRNPEIGISDLSGTVTGVVYDDPAYLLGWRAAP